MQPGDWVTVLITLPRFYNPSASGRRRRIERSKFDVTLGEIGRQFGGCTLHEDPKMGIWFSRGVVYEDDILLVEVDCPDTAATRQWVLEYAAEILVPRFEQEAIYVRLLRGTEVHVVEARRREP